MGKAQEKAACNRQLVPIRYLQPLSQGLRPCQLPLHRGAKPCGGRGLARSRNHPLCARTGGPGGISPLVQRPPGGLSVHFPPVESGRMPRSEALQGPGPLDRLWSPAFADSRRPTPHSRRGPEGLLRPQARNLFPPRRRKAECPEQTDCEFSPSVACGDSSLVRGSQGGWDIPCGTAALREPGNRAGASIKPPSGGFFILRNF